MRRRERIERVGRTAANETGRDHVRTSLAVESEAAGEDDGRGDETGEHGEGMLETSGDGYDDGKLAVEGVERWADLSSLSLEATGEREGESGHAEPGVVIVA